MLLCPRLTHRQLLLLLPLAAVLVSTLGLSALPGASAQNPPVTVLVNASADRKAINPQIYGLSYASTAALLDLNAPLNRQGAKGQGGQGGQWDVWQVRHKA